MLQKKGINEAVQSLEDESVKLYQLFKENQTKANKGKCHFLKKTKARSSNNKQIGCSECEKILGIKLDYNLNFQECLDLQNFEESNLQSQLIIKDCLLYEHLKTRKVNERIFHFTI